MITSDRMAAVDRNAAALGVPQAQLMESSGNAVARTVRGVVDPGAAVTIVGGRGNNGGDGFAAARFLDDYDLSIRLLGRRDSIATEITRQNWDALVESEVDARAVRDSADLEFGQPDVIVDGVLGTGISGAPREPERSAIHAINDAAAPVVSIDVPSGLDADTGEGSPAVDADRVVTFHDMKPGLVGRDDVTVADIGIPPAAERFTGPGDLLLLDRDPKSHKGEFGRIHVIGGGPYTGAPALAAQAALRGGADLAYVGAPETVSREIQGYSENLIVEDYPGARFTQDAVDGVLERARDRDVVVLGPGLGDAAETLDAVAEFLAAYDGKAVVDADALSVVPDVATDATLVCTPHQGELRDMGGPAADSWRERADRVAEFAAEVGHTILVKGAYDVVSDGEETRVNRTGNPGMTVGGTGDVLAGLTAALLAVQDPVSAAAIAAYANGRAGDMIVDRSGYGLVATDLLGELPVAIWGDRA